jgi:NDP-sugar pyrophosphorylase family protein
LVGSEGGREKRGEVSWIGVGVRVRPAEAAALFLRPLPVLFCSNKPMINYSIEPEKSLETDEASAFIYASLCSLPD